MVKNKELGNIFMEGENKILNFFESNDSFLCCYHIEAREAFSDLGVSSLIIYWVCLHVH